MNNATTITAMEIYRPSYTAFGPTKKYGHNGRRPPRKYAVATVMREMKGRLEGGSCAQFLNFITKSTSFGESAKFLVISSTVCLGTYGSNTSAMSAKIPWGSFAILCSASPRLATYDALRMSGAKKDREGKEPLTIRSGHRDMLLIPLRWHRQ